MTYTPNFSDPRVHRACVKAIEWTTTYLRPNKQQWLATREIQRHYGSQSRPLGKYLKNQLLICVNPFYDSLNGRCKTYMLNQTGLNALQEHLGIEITAQIPEWVEDQLDTGEITYADKGHREYHWLQNQPKQRKIKILRSKGYRHEYDIQCCAQTLILQHARSLGFKTETPALDQYIADRQSVREELKNRLGLDTTTIKKILTALLNGASISAWHENSIFTLVNYNKLMISILTEDPYIQQYQRDMRSVWKHLRGTQQLDKGERFNAKMKSEMYRFLEESVRVVIKRSLRKQKIRAFIEHDGWSCDTAVETNKLIYEVKKQTGFEIKLDWTTYESDDCFNI